MKNETLHQQCIQLYEEMQQHATGCESKASGDMKWIEWRNGEVVQSWFRVERMADGYQFVSDEEEFCFLMILQSKFAGWFNFLQYYVDPVVAAG
jgi:hypothetical protein